MKTQELSFKTLREIADESDEPLCVGCDNDTCACRLIPEHRKDTINEVSAGEDFASQIRLATRSINRYCEKHDLELPLELQEIKRMRRRTLIACQALHQFTPADVIQWSGDIKMKLYLFYGAQA